MRIDSVEPHRRQLTQTKVLAYLQTPGNVCWVKAKDLLGQANDACVDGRETEAVIATPGGDISLLTEGIISVGKFTGRQLTPVEINRVFRWRLRHLGSFYMHTDEQALDNLRLSLKTDNRFARKQFASARDVFGFVQNPDPRYQLSLIDHLITPKNIGCGHLKLMLLNSEAYGMSRKVIYDLMRAFFDTLWNGSAEEKQKINYKYLCGKHQEGAVVTILVPGEISEQTLIPAVRPSDGKTSVFVFHPQVSAFMHREQAVALAKSGLFPEISGKEGVFLKTTAAVLSEGLRETVSHLAFGLPQYTFKFS
jgi:hypothetical protein